MNQRVKEMMYCAMFAAIMAIIAPLKIDITGIVPITLQTLGVYLAGSLLRPKLAFIATLVYVLLGAVGLPVFAGYQGGIGVLVGATGGYIYSFPIVALCISYLLEKKDTIIMHGLALVVGTSICYLVGTAWFMYVTQNTLLTSLSLCVLPFLLGDTVKITVTILLSYKIRRKILK